MVQVDLKIQHTSSTVMQTSPTELQVVRQNRMLCSGRGLQTVILAAILHFDHWTHGGPIWKGVGRTSGQTQRLPTGGIHQIRCDMNTKYEYDTQRKPACDV